MDSCITDARYLIDSVTFLSYRVVLSSHMPKQAKSSTHVFVEANKRGAQHLFFNLYVNI